MQKSLLSRGNTLSSSSSQLEVLQATDGITPFREQLNTLGIQSLKPTQLEILQINMGKMCNQVCEHCHVDAGPDRKEIMTKETMLSCLGILENSSIQTVDLTGGAPEMNPDFLWFVEEIVKLGKEVIVRSNLTILTSNKKYKEYPLFFAKHKVTVVSSLPCYTEGNTDSQRGDGVFEKSIEALLVLNELGYGSDPELKLHLVYNPGGAHLPPAQEALEGDYKRELSANFGISFNSLYTITNLPISRYLDWLKVTEKYDDYMQLLFDNFNPMAIENVMCRNTVSVGWDGYLFDCDFNQMLDLKVASKGKHISELNIDELASRSIIVNQHCYGCTAGAGSSCQGSLV